jgi:two-component system CheB/CheR fusion protein
MAKTGRKAAKSARKPPKTDAAPVSGEPEGAAFPIVGIGASAGGLEAFSKLLHRLPADTGMALVLIQHLDPTHESILTTLLSRATRMPVQEATHQMPVEPNHVYVIPRNSNMRIVDSTLLLTRRNDSGTQHLPVDHFLQSLAESQKSKAIGVILSGTASDGTAGLRAIKSEGGITFAQEQSSAKFDGMPRSAILAGVVDFVLPPEEIARELAHISRHPYVASQASGRAAELLQAGQDDFHKIFSLLRIQTGSDFSSYKRGTIERRVRRRMVLRKFDKITEYVRLLQQDPDEVKALYEDLLISVTEFFRDPKVFEALKHQIFPKLWQDRATDSPIRIWSAGCSTGEEVYSIAMSLVDFMGERQADNSIQIFGTDISEIAVAKARLGLYSESSIAKIPKSLLQRHFTKADQGYRLSKRIRDICVFARQDLTRDPPFSKVDLISCRNVLIYLGQDLQNKVMPIFHYALRPDGYLLLGNSETAGASHFFSLVDKTHKIYAKKAVTDRVTLDLPRYSSPVEKPVAAVREEAWSGDGLQKEADRIVLNRYGPAGVVINGELEILQFRGDMSPYLKPASGAASLNFLRMVREDLVTDLRTALDLAKRGTAPVRKQGLRVDSDELRSRELNVEIIPVNAPQDHGRLFLVLIENVAHAAAAVAEKSEPAGSEPGDIEALKTELAAAREHLQFLMDERQASEEELRSANEEILSSNEELQSTNEELETSQEELQSANEELTTVNDELQNRNADLAQLGNDLSNLLNSVNIPIVMLGNDLHVRHFTPTAGRTLNLRSSDVGRPIVEIKSNLEIPDLEKLLSDVIMDLTPKEMEVQDRSGAWFSLRVRPYRTEDNKIDGAVMVLYDVDQLKRSLQEVRLARDFSQAIVETIPEPLVILDAELSVVTSNRAFRETFHLDRPSTGGKPFFELAHQQWDTPKIRECLGRALSHSGAVKGIEIEGDFQRIGHKIFSLNCRRIDLGEDKRKILLLAMLDVTAERQAERQLRTAHSALEKNLLHAESSLRESEVDLRQSREELRELAARLLTTQEEERRRVSRELHDDLNQKLAMLEVDVDRLGQRVAASPEIGADVQSLRDRVAEVSNDIRRVAYELHPSILDHLGLGVALRSYCSEFSKREGIKVKFSVQDQPESVREEVALCLYRVTQESLRNVAKHASAKTASVALAAGGDRLHLCVRDNGVGFDPTAKHKGGIGLLSMKERVRLVDGQFTLKSSRGHGTRIDIWAPLSKGTK